MGARVKALKLLFETTNVLQRKNNLVFLCWGLGTPLFLKAMALAFGRSRGVHTGLVQAYVCISFLHNAFETHEPGRKVELREMLKA